MSNRVTVQYTRFQNLDVVNHITGESYGYRIYDDYGTEYNNTFKSFEELEDYINELNVFEVIEEQHPQFFYGYEFDGVFINGIWIEKAEV